jgi:hypothetical protein
MWDVAWTDPSRELVGERRVKIDGDGEGVRDKTLPRNSVSTTSSKASGHSTLSRLRAKARHQSSSSKASSQPSTHASLEQQVHQESSKNPSRSNMPDTASRLTSGHLTASNSDLQAVASANGNEYPVRHRRHATVPLAQITSE